MIPTAKPTRGCASRRGYSLTVVLFFLMLLVALWSTAYRSSSSLLRIETARVLNRTRDEGAMNALARALRLLEHSKPSDPNKQYVYMVSIPTPDPSGGEEPVIREFVVKFEHVSPPESKRWKVHVQQPDTGTAARELPQPGDNPQWP